MLFRSHYAPRAKLVLFEEKLEDLAKRFAEAATRYSGVKLGLMVPTEVLPSLPAIPNSLAFPWGGWRSTEQLAHRVFAGLRFLDREGCAVILCPIPPDHGLGSAIRDRLIKAARPQATKSSAATD